MQVALFVTCLADTMFPQAAQATITILERLGHQVCSPEGQICYGQIHASTGYFKQAAKIARNHMRTFSPVLNGGWDAIIIPSGSYTDTARREQDFVAKHVGDMTLAKRVEQTAAHTCDLAELLVDVLGIGDVGAYFLRMVTYHPIYRSLCAVKVADRPYHLLKIVGIPTLIDLPSVEVCCGLGGTLSMKNSEASTAILADKTSNVMSTRTEVLCVGDYSCLMHIGGGLSRTNSGVRITYLAEILASTKDAPFEGNASFAPKHVQHTGSFQHIQAVAR